ncbi:MAG: hypothetical protein ACOY3P_26115 [Planctomycetota bacterium]
MTTAIAAVVVLTFALPAEAQQRGARRSAPAAHAAVSRPSPVNPVAGDAALEPSRESVLQSIDEAKVSAEGIRKLAGKHFVLYTDVPSSPEVDELPRVFDLAVPQLAAYFGVKPQTYDGWRMTGCIMAEKDRFRAAGLMPDSVPEFQHGWSKGRDLWMNEQQSAYYRRHLLIHEGTHGFMNTQLGGCGPPWYMEATAELMGTHLWANGQLKLGYMPPSREAFPYWGRIRLIRDAYAKADARPLPQIVELPPEAYGENIAYAWSWGVAAFLDAHPRYQSRFRSLGALAGKISRPEFNQRFRKLFDRDWIELCEEWQVFVSDVEYGYDVVRGAVDFTPGRTMSDPRTTVKVAADRGWQNTRVRLAAGATYRLAASGRYKLGTKPKDWWCEPGGVSLRYYRGQPLGVLVGAIRPDEPLLGDTSALLTPKVIGLGTEWTPEKSGTLFLRINDSGAERGDNSGELEVEIAAGPAGP